MTTYDLKPEARKVDAARATAWFAQGWRVFSATPGVWLVITVVLLVIHVVLGVIPAIGQVVSALLTSVFSAGLMQCSRSAVEGRTLHWDQMFAGFRRNTANLIVVGILTFVGFALISLVAFAIVGMIGGTALLSAIQSGSYSAIEMGTALVALLLALLIWMLLALPLTMAFWFAPALVMFDAVAPFEAMKSSFRASLRNWLVLSVYGIVLLVLAMIAAIPFGLGFLILIPVIAISVYLSYRDIYH